MFQLRQRLSLVGLIVLSLLGCTMELDISIPSFPSIMTFFGANESQVQSTLSLNFLAFCISGLLYGPLSEAWGRRGLMLFGASCFLVGALGCVLSFSIYQLMFWRFVQGIGASSTLVLGFTMISDSYKGETAARHISKINAYCTIFMAAAPILGSALIHFFSWRANFSLIALIALLSFVCLMLWLPETKSGQQVLKLKTIGSDYWHVISSKKFMLYAFLPNMLVTAYLTSVGSAAFYYINTCKLPVLVFAVHQGLLVGIFSLTSFYASKIINLIGSDKSVQLGMFSSCIGVLMLVSFAFIFPYKPWLITLSMCIFAFGCAFPMAVTFAESLEVIPSLKGTCSSFIMSSRLLWSSAAVTCTGVFFDGSMRPVAIVILSAVSAALVAYFVIEVDKRFQTKSLDLSTT